MKTRRILNSPARHVLLMGLIVFGLLSCGQLGFEKKKVFYVNSYAEEADQLPSDLALADSRGLLNKITADYPEMLWTPRIKFTGLLDIPDSNGDTRSQRPVVGIAADLISESSREIDILNLRKVLVKGRLPERRGEIVISQDLAEELEAEIGETATLITATMHGSPSTFNYIIVGTVHFGIAFLDRSTLITEITDIQYALDMDGSANEILGIFPNFLYEEDKAIEIASDFNTQNPIIDDFSPVMFSFSDQAGQGELLDIARYFSNIMISIFVIIMSIVLWNAGLRGSLRRYGEFGVRLAMGEDKGHLYRSLIAESLILGFTGSIIGTALGLAFAYYLQTKGIDVSSMTKNASVMIIDKIRAQITSTSFFIGFVPGFGATFLGTIISGIGIYKRQTSQLFNELEA